jgi:hypothetical protein
LPSRRLHLKARLKKMSGKVFKKHVNDPEGVWKKCLSLYEAGKSTGGFRTPCPLGFSEDEGWIEFERIHGLVPLAKVFPGLDAVEKLICLRSVGGALAGLHLFWRDEQGTIVDSIPSGNIDLLGDLPILAASQKVLVHGDFGLGNVFCLNGNWKELLFLDPEPAPYLPIPLRSIVTPALDIAHFCGCLEGVFPPSYYLRYPWRKTRELRTEFLNSYCKFLEISLPVGEVCTLTGRLLTAFGSWLQQSDHSFSNRVLGKFLCHRAQGLPSERI